MPTKHVNNKTSVKGLVTEKTPCGNGIFNVQKCTEGVMIILKY